MTDSVEIDSSWIADNPVPVHRRGTTKNSRGRVLVIGGSCRVPGALRLTGEAALRVGAGKLQMATVNPVALPLGLLVPEAAVLGCPQTKDGELDGSAIDGISDAIEGCDALVIGPGIGDAERAGALLKAVCRYAHDDLTLVVDAMAIGCLRNLREEAARLKGKLVLTPHHGEMAALEESTEEEVGRRPAEFACAVAATYGAVVVLKGSDTVIASPDGDMLHYVGGGTGLATGGSGDVLAGAIAGLLSRGASPLSAAGWGVWLHGQSGRRVATTRGPIGFLAREVPAEFPRLLPQ